MRFIKDPQTGKRVSRLNPASAWVTKEVPELRIVDQALWDQVKVRQAALQGTRARKDHRAIGTAAVPGICSPA